MSAPRDPIDIAQRLCAELERRGISYALGGALSFGLHAEPRGTKDVDVNAFVEAEHVPAVCEAVRAIGGTIDDNVALGQAAQQGMFVAYVGPFRVDVFTPSIDFAWEAERTRVRRTLEGQPVWALSAEAITVFKLLFFRRRDQADIEQMLRTCPSLDRAYVRARIAEMMGDDDVRVRFFDQLVDEVGGD